MRPAVALLAATLLGGCAVRAQFASLPAGAFVELPSGKVVTTPTTAKVRWVPFIRQPIVARAPGYRDLRVGLKSGGVSSWRVLGGLLRPFAWTRDEPRFSFEFVLVPEHGPSGEWTPATEGLAE